METNIIPTTEDFFNKYKELYSFEEGNSKYLIDKENFKKAMVEFAQLHVKAALKEGLESIPCLGSSTDIPTYEEVENEVLNAYPKDNIK